MKELLKTADVVSFHTALVPATHHLLNADNIKLMKDDAIVVNTSRGAVIDNDAVAAAPLRRRALGRRHRRVRARAGLAGRPIMHAPHPCSPRTPPTGPRSPLELRRRCTQNAIDVVLGRTPEACVNPEALPAALAK